MGNTPRELSYLLQYAPRPGFTAAADHWRVEHPDRHVVLLSNADWTRVAWGAGPQDPNSSAPRHIQGLKAVIGDLFRPSSDQTPDGNETEPDRLGQRAGLLWPGRRLCAGCWLLVELEADRPSKRGLRDPACPARQPAGNMIQRALDGMGVGVSSAARDAGASPSTILGSCSSMEYSMVVLTCGCLAQGRRSSQL